MKLWEYVEGLKQDVDEFFEMWEDSHSVDPEQWPLELTEDEWQEQFLAWTEGRA